MLETCFRSFHNFMRICFTQFTKNHSEFFTAFYPVQDSSRRLFKKMSIRSLSEFHLDVHQDFILKSLRIPNLYSTEFHVGMFQSFSMEYFKFSYWKHIRFYFWILHNFVPEFFKTSSWKLLIFSLCNIMRVFINLSLLEHLRKYISPYLSSI